MNHKLQLYSRGSSSACERVRLALELKGLDYETVIIADMRAGEYITINPQGLMPALRIDGRVVSQSMAMLEFLEEEYSEPALLPADPTGRAEVRAFCQIIASDIHPVGINRIRKKLRDGFGLSEDQTLEWYTYWNETGFATLEQILAGTRKQGPWCFGQTPTFADIVLVPHMHTARGLGVDFSGFPSVMSVFEHCIRQPAFVEAARENQPDA